MNNINTLDINNIKKLKEERNKFILSGSSKEINKVTKTSNLVIGLKPGNIRVIVKKILKENEFCKTVVLQEINNKPLPEYKAGQKIALTIKIDGNIYTRNYTLVGDIKDTSNGEYRIAIFNYDDDLINEYIFNKLEVDQEVRVSSAYGDFYYDSLRDEKQVMMIVSDKGIAPAYAIAQAVNEGILKIKLTIFYSEKTNNRLAYKDELIELANNPLIRIGFVLSEEVTEDSLEGFVSLDKIKAELNGNRATFFISGNEGLLKYIERELEPLNLPNKFIKYEKYLPTCNIKKQEEYKLTLYLKDDIYDIPCFNNKTILEAIEDSGAYIRNKCRNGTCMLCRSELVKGEVKIINDKRNEVDKRYNYIHPCTTYPLSDIEIIVR